MYILTQCKNDKHIKGKKKKKKLDLTQYIKLISEKFHEFEKDRKGKVIEDFQGKMYVLSNKVEKSENNIDN